MIDTLEPPIVMKPETSLPGAGNWRENNNNNNNKENEEGDIDGSSETPGRTLKSGSEMAYSND